MLIRLKIMNEYLSGAFLFLLGIYIDELHSAEFNKSGGPAGHQVRIL